MLAATYYVLFGSIVMNDTLQKGLHFSLGIGAGYNIIRRNAPLFSGRSVSIDKWTLNEANLKPLSLTEMVSLTGWLVNTQYVVMFLIAENFAVDVIIGTYLPNKYFIKNPCRENRVKFRRYMVPTLRGGT